MRSRRQPFVVVSVIVAFVDKPDGVRSGPMERSCFAIFHKFKYSSPLHFVLNHKIAIILCNLMYILRVHWHGCRLVCILCTIDATIFTREQLIIILIDLKIDNQIVFHVSCVLCIHVYWGMSR